MSKDLYTFSVEESEVIKELLIKLQKENKKIPFDKEIYCIIPLFFLCKNKLLITNLIFHPLLIKERYFYEEKKQITDRKEILSVLKNIIEYELEAELNNQKLNSSELKRVIKVYNKINNYYIGAKKRQEKKHKTPEL